jgi:Uma2 family endonuclease
MANERARPGFVSIDEFLAFENASPTRHEYVAGQVYAMSGTTARHNDIASNIHASLRSAVRGGPCKAYIIDLKVRVGQDRIYYPDGLAVCTPHAGDTLVFDDPCLIIEVTSRGTRRIDHGEKMGAYLGLPSLRGYLIAEHDRRRVTLYSRADAGDWTRTELFASGHLELPCPRSTLSLDEIYDGVELPPLRVSEELDDEDTWVDPIQLTSLVEDQ